MASGGILYIEIRLADVHLFVVTMNHDKTYTFDTSEEAARFIKEWLDGAFPSTNNKFP